MIKVIPSVRSCHGILRNFVMMEYWWWNIDDGYGIDDGFDDGLMMELMMEYWWSFVRSCHGILTQYYWGASMTPPARHVTQKNENCGQKMASNSVIRPKHIEWIIRNDTHFGIFLTFFENSENDLRGRKNMFWPRIHRGQ